MTYADEREQRMNSILLGLADEKPSLYSVLDEKARSWWYHKELREKGQVTEARKRERKAIRDSIRTIKLALENGGYATISQSGGTFTINYGDGCNVSGYDESLVTSAWLAGIPVVDWRFVESSADIISMPMPCIGNSNIYTDKMQDDIDRLGDDYPSAYSYVPVHDYIQRAMQVGASLHYAPTHRTKNNHYIGVDA